MSYATKSLVVVCFVICQAQALASEVQFRLNGQVSASSADALPIGTAFELLVSYDGATSPSIEGEDATYPNAILDASLSAGNGMQFEFVRNEAGNNVIQTTTSNEPGDIVTMRLGDFTNDAIVQEAYISLSFPFAKSLLASSDIGDLESILATPEFLDANDVLGRDFPSFQLTDGADINVIANSSTLAITLVPEPNSSTLLLIAAPIACLVCSSRRRRIRRNCLPGLTQKRKV